MILKRVPIRIDVTVFKEAIRPVSEKKWIYQFIIRLLSGY